MAELLNGLIKVKVPTHLESTKAFIESIKNCPIPSSTVKFGSLDVCNLYGSIPLEDDETNDITGLIKVASEFFELHRNLTSAPELEKDDFRKILRLILFEDTYLLEGEHKKQVNGIAMGNCAAPPLAIIYMHKIESEILRRSPDIIFWKRYIDDVFFITNSTPDSLLATSNAINKFIQFTLEEPVNNELPFLDTLAVFNKDINEFKFSLFIKPTHSGTCLSYNSYVPVTRKKCLIISETLRCNTIASGDNESLEKIDKKFSKNGYPNKFIAQTRRNLSLIPKDKIEPLTYLKLPYITEAQRSQIAKLANRTGQANNVRFIFTTERPLSWQFRPKTVMQKCPDNCIACLTAEKADSCFIKYAVYLISCNLCDKVYVGQTERTIRSRVAEHTKCTQSHVYKHLQIHNNNPENAFHWKVLTTQAVNNTRLAIESLFIHQYKDKLMNGCESIRLLPFLQ
jgi:hypothetical protein